MPMCEAAVVIPVYKETLTDFESIALNQCMKVLGKHPIVFFAPEGLPVEWTGTNVRIVRFDPHYFESIAEHSKLMLSPEFYKRFLEYNYILIYHLDAFVFRDELLFWCSKGFDYIGAPWVGNKWWNNYTFRKTLPWGIRLKNLIGFEKDRRVGNGGFSLRRTERFFSILSNFQSEAKNWPFNCDGFWAIAAPNLCPSFKIPSRRLALNFAFELAPRDCFKRNGYKLPFGCHAWWKFDISFWRSIFKEYGYTI